MRHVLHVLRETLDAIVTDLKGCCSFGVVMYNRYEASDRYGQEKVITLKLVQEVVAMMETTGQFIETTRQ